MSKKKVLVLVGLLVLVSISVTIAAPPVEAHGFCVPGYAYRDAGTNHNYVEFRVNFSAVNWHTHKPWWAFSIDPWANPDGNGIVKAGIQGTDYNPPYSPSVYQLCGTS